MPKRIMPLTNTQIDKAKPQAKETKMFDGGGLYLLITPTGGKLWYLKFRYAGKEGKLSFGTYPAISLADARQRREEAKKLIANGVDPRNVKKAQKAAQGEQSANTFEVIEE